MNQAIRNNPFFARVDRFFQSAYFPLALALPVLLANVLGLDFLGFGVVIACVVWISLFCADTKPVLACILYAVFCVSPQNSPGYGDGANFYTTLPVLLSLGILGAIAIAALVTRLIVSGDRRNIFRKRFLAVGLIVVCAVLLLGGIGSRWYAIDHVWLVGLEIFCLLGLYVFFSATIRYEGEQTLIYFARVCAVALGIITVELVAFYLRYYELGTPLNSAWKDKICVGWGVSNVIGELMVMLVPACFYLMQKERHGWAYYLMAIACTAIMVFTFSRNAILFGAPLALGCAIYSAFFGKNNRRTYLWMSLGVLALLGIAALVLFVWTDYGTELFSFFIKAGTDGRGREAFWARWIGYFKEYPLFGAGLAADKVTQGHHSIFQRLAHNTLIQFLCSCGIVGLLGYLFHRVQTVILYVHKPTLGRSFLGVAVAVFCLMALLDTIFFITYTLIYYVTFLVFTEKDYEYTREQARAAEDTAPQVGQAPAAEDTPQPQGCAAPDNGQQA